MPTTPVTLVVLGGVEEEEHCGQLLALSGGFQSVTPVKYKF